MTDADVEKLKDMATLFSEIKGLVDKNGQAMKDQEGMLQLVNISNF